LHWSKWDSCSFILATSWAPLRAATSTRNFIPWESYASELLGNKSNNETYRPDEIDVLGFATHQLALDLVALRVEQLEQCSSDIKCESQIREHEAAVLRDQLKAAMQLLKSTDAVPTR